MGKYVIHGELREIQETPPEKVEKKDGGSATVGGAAIGGVVGGLAGGPAGAVAGGIIGGVIGILCDVFGDS